MAYPVLQSVANLSAPSALPPGLAAGDLMVALVVVTSTTTYAGRTVPAGWVKLGDTVQLLFFGAYPTTIDIYVKIAEASEPEPVFGGSDLLFAKARIARVVGAAGLPTISAVNASTSGTSFSFSFPSVTSTSDESLILTVGETFGDDWANPDTYPSYAPSWGYGVKGDTDTAYAFVGYNQATAGSSGTKAVTVNPAPTTAAPMYGWSIVIPSGVSAPPPVTVNYQITDTADDGNEDSDQFWNGNVEFGYGFHLGLRWPSIQVPNNATIVSAKVSLVTLGGAGLVGNVYGVASDNAPQWTTTTVTPTKVAKTSASVAYSYPINQYDDYITPVDIDVTGPLQEVVNRSGWARGNAFAIAGIAAATRVGFLSARDVSHIPADAAKLSITYTTGGGAPAPTLNTLTTTPTLLKVPVDAPVGTVIATVSGLTTGSTRSDNATEFELVGNELRVAGSLDLAYEMGGVGVDITETLAGASNSPKSTHFDVNVTAPRICEFVGQATGTTTPVIPAHVAGDMIVLWLFRDGNVTAPALPSGFTSLITGSGNTTSFRVAYRIATASGTSGGGALTATSTICHVYRPAAGYALSMGASAQATGSSATVSYPALTLQDTSGLSWVVGFTGHRSTNTALELPPTGMVARSNVIDTTDEASGFDTDGGVSSWPLRTVPVGGTASGWISATVEIKGTATGGISYRRRSTWISLID